MSLSNHIVPIDNKEHFQMINNINYVAHYRSFIFIINSLTSNYNLQTFAKSTFLDRDSEQSSLVNIRARYNISDESAIVVEKSKDHVHYFHHSSCSSFSKNTNKTYDYFHLGPWHTPRESTFDLNTIGKRRDTNLIYISWERRKRYKINVTNSTRRSKFLMSIVRVR